LTIVKKLQRKKVVKDEEVMRMKMRIVNQTMREMGYL